MARAALLMGPKRSARTSRINALLVERWGSAILLVPSRRQARARLDAILRDHDLPGAWGDPIQTFEDFAAVLLRSEGIFAEPIDEIERRMLLEQAIARICGRKGSGRMEEFADNRGFLAHALKTITQLKQAAVDPAAFRQQLQQRKRPSALDCSMADLYETYQAILQEKSAYDRIGVLWEACDLAQRLRPAAMEGVRALLLDAFDDFTPSEFRLIEAIARHVDEIFWGINAEQDNPSAVDLYAAPLRTARMVRARFAGLTEHVFSAPPPASWTECASQELFWRNRPTSLDGLEQNIFARVYADPVQEMEDVCRRVKGLHLERKIPFDRIAIVCWDLQKMARPLRTALTGFGVPFGMIQRVAIGETAPGAFALTLLDALTAWKRDDVVEVVTSRWNATSDSGDDVFAQCLPMIVRLAHIIEGRDEWLSGLDRLSRLLESSESAETRDLLRRFPHLPNALAWTIKKVAAFDAMSARFADQASLASYLDVFVALLERDLSIAQTLVHARESEKFREVSAIQALFQTIGRLAAWRVEQTPMPRSRFFALLRQAIHETLCDDHSDQAGVMCFDADLVRNLEFDYVFFFGLNEGVVPRPRAINAVYSDADIADLREAGIPFETKEEHTQREMLLFAHVIASARVALNISWSHLGADGRERLESPYLRSLRELLPEIPVDVRCNALAPEVSAIASWRDLANAAFDGPASLRQCFSDRFRWIEMGCSLEKRRESRCPLDAYDGMVSDAAARRLLRDEYGEDRLFSVGQLETYAACPFCYFVERVLGISDIATPAAEFDPRVRGRILHVALQRFHEHYRGKAILEIDPGEAHAVMCDILEACFHEHAWRSANAPRGVAGVEQAQLRARLLRYLRREAGNSQEACWKPMHFEISFGRAPRESDSEWNTAEAFALQRDGKILRLSGRMDRIDIHDQQSLARIIDYKTVLRVSSAAIDAGRSLQLSLYALALEALLLKGFVCAEGRFVVPGDDSLEALGRSEKNPKWETRRQVAIDAAFHGAEGIRDGKFPPSPSETACRYCPFRRACRYEEWRIAAKLEESPL
ncbi:MAG TPA: PD-(D/E)XK nuclease family protein [Candidatus Hydrogenedentes bacterium]|nr:PD-(D/E)XK nuclease family protein [Candidatus Hydrogenedentota bacterium]HOS01949.1 PD-(D/E)XK nuclease family protein [Candidatus Hydrogenedentota bacterium]